MLIALGILTALTGAGVYLAERRDRPRRRAERLAAATQPVA